MSVLTGIRVSVVGLHRGPASLESDYEDALAVPDLLKKVQAGTREGVDAVIIDCLFDPGLGPAREFGSIPLLGAAMAAKMAEALLDMGLSHSRRSYPTPREKAVVGYA